MTDIINLRQKRKAKGRNQKEKQAEQNRILHGRTKSEKEKKKLEDKRSLQHIEGHKRDQDDEE